MIQPNPNPNETAEAWKPKLDQFVKNNEQKLAAVAWGLYQERKQNNNDDVLGIDLHPNPRFVNCPRPALEKLNQNVEGKIQEILGIVDNHNPEEEVVIIGLGDGQIKLLYFQPELSPPQCFDQATENLDTIMESLEIRLLQQLQ
jgi:hypothetical protein